MPDLQTLTVYIAPAAAAVSVVSTLVSTTISYLQKRKKLQDAEQKSFDEALGSDDLETIGRYLDENIGRFDVSEYVGNRDVTGRVDQYLSKIQEYIGTPEEIEEEEKVKPPPEEKISEHLTDLFTETPPSPFDEVLQELTLGERWNALARLRRHIEIRLREVALKLGYKERHLRSAGQILHILSDNSSVSRSAVEELRYPVSVCNRAIHGRDVSEAEAVEAIWMAYRSLPKLWPGEESA